MDEKDIVRMYQTLFHLIMSLQQQEAYSEALYQRCFLKGGGDADLSAANTDTMANAIKSRILAIHST